MVHHQVPGQILSFHHADFNILSTLLASKDKDNLRFGPVCLRFGRLGPFWRSCEPVEAEGKEVEKEKYSVDYIIMWTFIVI